MSTHEHSRRAHELVDAIKDGYTPDRADVDFLRSFLPELPKQKTLEDLRHAAYAAWSGTHGNKWLDDVDGDLETWLCELHAQLKGLEVAATIAPALPAGMRIAKHEEYGRCVVSPGRNHFGQCMIFVLDSDREEGSDWHYEPSTSLTFLDTSPTERAHPEFLETEADYQNAPVGTVVIREGGYPWTRIFDSWVAYSRNDYSHSEMAALRGKSRVLRWAVGNEQL